MTSASRSLSASLGALAAVAATLGCLALPAAADVAVPRLSARVTDQTGTLSTPQRDMLEAKLAAFEAKKGSQIAVLLVPSTQPETIEQYSIRVVDQWKLGRARVDDGVLLVVAKNDKRLRIEVGRGLEGAIPDATARRVIAEYIAPHFKQGDFAGGISAGVDRLMALVEGEPLPAPQEAWSGVPAGSDGMDWMNALFIGVVVLMILNGVLRTVLGRFGAAGVTGAAIGVLVWIVFSVLAYAAIGAVIAFIVALVTGGSRGWSSRGGGWSSGGWSSGGGGGYSGGGGSFGGGGSSGSW